MKKLKQLLYTVCDQIAFRKRLRYFLIMSGGTFGGPVYRSNLFVSKRSIDEFFEVYDRIPSTETKAEAASEETLLN